MRIYDQSIRDLHKTSLNKQDFFDEMRRTALRSLTIQQNGRPHLRRSVLTEVGTESE